MCHAAREANTLTGSYYIPNNAEPRSMDLNLFIASGRYSIQEQIISHPSGCEEQ